MPELVARVKRQITTISSMKDDCCEEVYKFSNLTINVSDHKVLLDDKEVHLSKKEFMILSHLVIHSGKLIMQCQMSTRFAGKRQLTLPILS